MKRFLAVIAGLLLFFSIGTTTVSAENQVEKLHIDVALDKDGTAYVTQEFYTITDEGTEFYLERKDSGYLTFSDFSVRDENGSYMILPENEWDVKASFEEKAGKCGMRDLEDGVELCWGITEYGEQHYTVEYAIHNFVSSYSDADGVLYQLIDPYQEVFPTEAEIIIRMQDGTPLTDEECDIWAFGYDGYIQFENGVIRAYTQTPLEDEAKIILMVCFEKGVLEPVHTVDSSFEMVKTKAFEGSDYDSKTTEYENPVMLIVIGASMFFGGIFGLNAILEFIEMVKRRKLLSEAEYFRDIPNSGNLNVTYVLGSSLGFFTEEHYLGARILRLLILGSLEPEGGSDKKETVSMRLVREPHNGDVFDEAFYTFLQAAAGADGVLQAKELEDFCKEPSHAQMLSRMLENCAQDGNLTLVRQGCLTGAVCKEAKNLTPEGKKQLLELLGLKRYLQDFSLLAERNVEETFLWQEYMVYAMMLGIAERVMKQLKELYPDRIPQIQKYQWYMDGTYRYNRLLHASVELERQRLKEEQEMRSGGRGGRASRGGGRGSSGGGRMGTR